MGPLPQLTTRAPTRARRASSSGQVSCVDEIFCTRRGTTFGYGGKKAPGGHLNPEGCVARKLPSPLPSIPDPSLRRVSWLEWRDGGGGGGGGWVPSHVGLEFLPEIPISPSPPPPHPPNWPARPTASCSFQICMYDFLAVASSSSSPSFHAL